MEGLWRVRENGGNRGDDCKVNTLTGLQHFSTRLTETRVFLGIRKSDQHRCKQIPNRWLTNSSVRKSQQWETYIHFFKRSIHWFLHPLIHSFMSCMFSLIQEVSETGQSRIRIHSCVSIAIFIIFSGDMQKKHFPQKLNSSCLTPPPPPLFSSRRFRFSASQLRGVETGPHSFIIHQP